MSAFLHIYMELFTFWGCYFALFLIYNKGVFKLEMTERLGVLTEKEFYHEFFEEYLGRI